MNSVSSTSSSQSESSVQKSSLKLRKSRSDESPTILKKAKSRKSADSGRYSSLETPAEKGQRKLNDEDKKPKGQQKNQPIQQGIPNVVVQLSSLGNKDNESADEPTQYIEKYAQRSSWKEDSVCTSEQCYKEKKEKANLEPRVGASELANRERTFDSRAAASAASDSRERKSKSSTIASTKKEIDGIKNKGELDFESKKDAKKGKSSPKSPSAGRNRSTVEHDRITSKNWDESSRFSDERLIDRPTGRRSSIVLVVIPSGSSEIRISERDPPITKAVKAKVRSRRAKTNERLDRLALGPDRSSESLEKSDRKTSKMAAETSLQQKNDDEYPLKNQTKIKEKNHQNGRTLRSASSESVLRSTDGQKARDTRQMRKSATMPVEIRHRDGGSASSHKLFISTSQDGVCIDFSTLD